MTDDGDQILTKGQWPKYVKFNCHALTVKFYNHLIPSNCILSTKIFFGEGVIKILLKFKTA